MRPFCSKHHSIKAKLFRLDQEFVNCQRSLSPPYSHITYRMEAGLDLEIFWIACRLFLTVNDSG